LSDGRVDWAISTRERLEFDELLFWFQITSGPPWPSVETSLNPFEVNYYAESDFPSTGGGANITAA